MHLLLSAMLRCDGSHIAGGDLPKAKSNDLCALGEIHPHTESQRKPVCLGNGKSGVESSIGKVSAGNYG